MNLLTLAARNLTRRPGRTVLTVTGLAAALGTLAILSALGDGYQRSLRTLLEQTGWQLMLVPLGCPYDAAARVLQGEPVENSLPEIALEQVRRDPAVAVAAPMLLAAIPRPDEARTDLWVGLDRSALALKPWWRAAAGAAWFAHSNSVILGSEAALAELRSPGDRLHCPEARATFEVAGVLARSGTSDDSLFFLPLATAQQVFGQPGRLSAIALRLRDPAALSAASRRLQAIPGAQVVTLTEVTGVFVNLVGTVRALMLGISIVALTAGVLSAFNTLLASVLERTGELTLLRALGASRTHLLALLGTEALLLTTLAAALGVAGAGLGGPWVERLIRPLVPLTPPAVWAGLSPAVVGQCLAAGAGAGLLAVLYPAWRAARLAPARAVQPA